MSPFAFAILAAILAGEVWYPTPDISRQELESRYLAAPSDLRQVAGTVLHVRDSGSRDAPAILLLHGLGAHLQTFDAWTEDLQSDYRVIRLDWPGSGLSPPDTTVNYTDERSMELLLALLDQLAVTKTHVAGNSIGGRIAWRFAAAHPERVEGLILISPDGFSSPGFQYRQAPKIPAVMQAIKYALPKSLLRSSLMIAYSDPSRLSGQTLTRYHDLMRGPGSREALLERMQQTILIPPEPLLKTIKGPVLLLWGEDDGMIPIANAADYQRNLANATLVRLPNSGHVPQEETPAQSLQPVRAFLEQFSKAPG